MDKNELDILRHSTAHVMAHAVKKLFPEALVTIGPAIEDGFYYDFDVPTPFTPDDLEAISEQMQKIIKADTAFVRSELSKTEAEQMFADEPYKLELLEAIPEGENISVYEEDGFKDLCRGPHLQSTGQIPAFKLLSTAGAYWRGDERNKMLQRIYGTAFPSQADLDAYLERLAEAEKRDHRKLGRDLDLFSLQEEAGPGLVFWHPKGALVRKSIEDYWREEHLEHGYDLLYTPHIALRELWKTSGHLDFFSEGMFAPMDVDGKPYLIKPMNCPFHLLIYKSKVRSYRELPLRWAELGTVYRYERSGALHGLLRVRGFTQDDAHIMCTREQLDSETKRCINFVLMILKRFGFSEYEIYLSTRPENSVGSDEVWEQATTSLESSLKDTGLPYSIDIGGGAFYGPKIDVKIKDAMGRAHQCSTIQVDFNEPERFDITYVGQDNAQHRPIMIHRALLGSLERFMAVLTEHYAGAFPLWLSPVQVEVLPIADRHVDYADSVRAQLKKQGFRVHVDDRNEKMGFKIREAQLQKVNYMLVAGDKEVESGKVSVRSRSEGDLGVMGIEELVEKLYIELTS